MWWVRLEVMNLQPFDYRSNAQTIEPLQAIEKMLICAKMTIPRKLVTKALTVKQLKPLKPLIVKQLDENFKN